VDWIHLAQDRDQCRALVITGTKIRIPYIVFGFWLAEDLTACTEGLCSKEVLSLQGDVWTAIAQPVIASRYEPDGLGIESRWEARFSVPVHTGPGAHPASYTVGTGSFSQG
jgi:hypothetical protein